MSDERLQILKMVEEGKVSAEEATRLLDAVETGPKAAKGVRPTHIRIHAVEGKKVTNFSVGVDLARWVLSLPLGTVWLNDKKIDTDQLVQLIDSGVIGKVLEVTEGDKRFEVWLDP